MKQLLSLAMIFIFFGCSTSVAEEDLKQLNGYWEITEVTFPDGNTKDFKVNPTVDYIELEGLAGFRKKMQPKFDGSFTTSNDAEPFTIERKENIFEFHYKNDMSEWREQIIDVSNNTFSVVNETNVTYTYKRFEPINADE